MRLHIVILTASSAMIAGMIPSLAHATCPSNLPNAQRNSNGVSQCCPANSTANCIDEPGTGSNPLNAAGGYDTPSGGGSGNKNCKVSTAINAQYDCSSTENLMSIQQGTNIIGQVVGSMAVNTAGGFNQMSAMQQGTQTAAMQGAAATQRLGGESQLALGAVNIGLGAAMFADGMNHKQNAEDLTKGSDKTNQNLEKDPSGQFHGAAGSVADRIIRNGVTRSGRGDQDLNEVAGAQVARAAGPSRTAVPSGVDPLKTKLAGMVNSAGQNAADEQIAVGGKAKVAGIMAIVQGVGQAAMGTFGMMAADQMDQAANQLQQMQNNTAGVAFAPPASNLDPNADNFNRPSTAINPGTAPDQAAASTDDTAQPTDGVSLGDPINIPPPASGVAGPPAGHLTAGNGGAPGGGGAAAGMGGGSTSPANPDEAPQAKQADQRRDGSSFAYQGGGAYMTSGAVGADKGPDLSGLLAQFLPKKEEEMKKPGGIMDFAGGRSPAGADGVLGREGNLFQRVSGAMAMKYRSGFVGI